VVQVLLHPAERGGDVFSVAVQRRQRAELRLRGRVGHRHPRIMQAAAFRDHALDNLPVTGERRP
jgi:hypothetical protein